jgi:hypothetical protein
VLSELDHFYLRKEEPLQSCLLAVRDLILNHNPSISQEWKYGMPFFCYKGKMLCYIHFHKKHKQPYLGFYDIQSPDLLAEGRSRVTIFLFEPSQDLPVKTIIKILEKAISR